MLLVVRLSSYRDFEIFLASIDLLTVGRDLVKASWHLFPAADRDGQDVSLRYANPEGDWELSVEARVLGAARRTTADFVWE